MQVLQNILFAEGKGISERLHWLVLLAFSLPRPKICGRGLHKGRGLLFSYMKYIPSTCKSLTFLGQKVDAELPAQPSGPVLKLPRD